DAPHAEWKTPLIISAQKGLTKATRLLLDLNVDKDAKDNCGRTALHYAVEDGSEAVVQLLVEQGADKRITDNCEETALHIAVK
ncbi:ankyrin repeat protein, partial [Trichophaea hybrida]